MTPSLAYRDGWLAHALTDGEAMLVHNPYHAMLQQASHRDWLQGHRDRAAKLPGAYLEILDQEMMGS